MPKHKQSDHKVGDKRPPREHQFVKGKSGNPRGRPKRAPSMDDLWLEEAARKIGVNTPKGTLRITRAEALIRRIMTRSLEGDMRAAKLSLMMLGAAQANSHSRDSNDPGDAVTDQETIARMLARFSK